MIQKENIPLFLLSLALATGAFIFVQNKVVEAELHQADARRGESIYESHCSICHGKSGEGLSKDDKYDLVNDRSHLLVGNELLIRSISKSETCYPKQVGWNQILSDDDMGAAIDFIRVEFYSAYDLNQFPGAASPKRGGLRD